MEKFLIIVANNVTARHLKQMLDVKGNYLPYSADIAVTNNHIVDVMKKSDNLDEVSKAETEALKPLLIKGKEVSDFYKVKADGEWKENGKKIMTLIKANSYTKILNGCGKGEAASYSFQYMVDSLNLYKYTRGDLNFINMSQGSILAAIDAVRERVEYNPLCRSVTLWPLREGDVIEIDEYLAKLLFFKKYSKFGIHESWKSDGTYITERSYQQYSNHGLHYYKFDTLIKHLNDYKGKEPVKYMLVSFSEDHKLYFQPLK